MFQLNQSANKGPNTHVPWITQPAKLLFNDPAQGPKMDPILLEDNKKLKATAEALKAVPPSVSIRGLGDSIGAFFGPASKDSDQATTSPNPAQAALQLDPAPPYTPFPAK